MGIRGHLPVRANRRLLMRAHGRFDPPRRAQMVSMMRFGQARWEVTCDQGANGSIAHLQLESTGGLARLLPRHLRFIYLTVVGDRMLRTIDDYAANLRRSGRDSGLRSRTRVG
jgi:hypothetical protein